MGVYKLKDRVRIAGDCMGVYTLPERWAVSCHLCGVTIGERAELRNPRDAVIMAEQHGWKAEGCRWLCPGHQEKGDKNGDKRVIDSV